MGRKMGKKAVLQRHEAWNYVWCVCLYVYIRAFIINVTFWAKEPVRRLHFVPIDFLTDACLSLLIITLYTFIPRNQHPWIRAASDLATNMHALSRVIMDHGRRKNRIPSGFQPPLFIASFI